MQRKMHERVCMRGYARQDMCKSYTHERICMRPYAREDTHERKGTSSACPCSAYPLLHVSCLQNILFLLASRWDGAHSAKLRPSALIGVVEVQKLMVSFAISAVRARPSAAIGVVEVNH